LEPDLRWVCLGRRGMVVMASNAATEGGSASDRCCAGMCSSLFPPPVDRPLVCPDVFDPGNRAFSGEGTSTGRLGLRIISAVVGGGVRDLLSAARGRCLGSGVAGGLSRELLRSACLCSITGVVGGGQEYLNERGTSMLLPTMALIRKGRVSRPCRGSVEGPLVKDTLSAVPSRPFAGSGSVVVMRRRTSRRRLSSRTQVF
jgi:hypothetical protein